MECRDNETNYVKIVTEIQKVRKISHLFINVRHSLSSHSYTLYSVFKHVCH